MKKFGSVTWTVSDGRRLLPLWSVHTQILQDVQCVRPKRQCIANNGYQLAYGTRCTIMYASSNCKNVGMCKNISQALNISGQQFVLDGVGVYATSHVRFRVGRHKSAGQTPGGLRQDTHGKRCRVCTIDYPRQFGRQSCAYIRHVC